MTNSMTDNQPIGAGPEQDTAGPLHRPLCNLCNSKMVRLYIRDYNPRNHSRPYIGVGWMCLECGNIIRD